MTQPQAHAPQHAAHQGHREPNYAGVIFILAILTVAEIAVTFLPLPKLSIGILLVGMALTKAILVAMYFMHLKFEKPVLALIAATPLILCTMLMFALLPDSDSKSNLGQTPAVSQPSSEHAPPAHP